MLSYYCSKQGMSKARGKMTSETFFSFSSLAKKSLLKSLQSSKAVNKGMKCKGSNGYPSSSHIKAIIDHNLTWFLLFLLSLSCENLTEAELSVGTVLSYDSLDLITGHRHLECSDKEWALELDLCMCGRKWTSQGLEEEEQRRRQTGHRIGDI